METKKLIAALRWREDVDRGEMISKVITPADSTHFDKHHYAFGSSTSQDTLDWICRTANLWFELHDSPLRVTNSMGELIPGHTKEGRKW